LQQPTEIEKLLGELELAVDRVRSLYDQYFMGIEKLEPTVPRKDIERRVHALLKEQIRNTALRFRFQMILQRYNTFQSHWQRICREIENGTYKRHVLRADRRFARTSSLPPPVPAQAVSKPPSDIDRELALLEADFAPPPLRSASLESPEPFEPHTLARSQAPKPARPPFPTPPPTSPGLGPAAARALPARPQLRRLVAEAPPMAGVPSPARVTALPPRPDPPATPPRADPPAPPPRVAPNRPADKALPRKEESLPEYRVRELYVEYVETKRRQNESTVAVTYDALAQSLRDSSAKLRQKHGKPVDFVVAVRNGKAILKPVLK
jgi:hypothetical protein